MDCANGWEVLVSTGGCIRIYGNNDVLASRGPQGKERRWWLEPMGWQLATGTWRTWQRPGLSH